MLYEAICNLLQDQDLVVCHSASEATPELFSFWIMGSKGKLVAITGMESIAPKTVMDSFTEKKVEFVMVWVHAVLSGTT